eukprot:Sspe_Gene.59034::Locus_32422_Transcript_1_1_Confidence_1.000_Length_970::g.59034::m.59034/K01737/queD, ptpS, PTS; 6-pyruvoyltetrahydropterin/6-carboxytetrahydropterin synthase
MESNKEGVNPVVSANELCSKGNELYALGKHWEAVDCYTRALDLKPEDAHLHSNRSAAYLNLRKGDMALLDARRCVELRPNWSKGYVKASLALRLLGRHGEAASLLERAAELEPHDPHIRLLQRMPSTEEMVSLALGKTSPLSEVQAEHTSPAYCHEDIREVLAPVVDVVGKTEFSAALRLAVSALSPSANAELFGKGSAVHGHNFQLEVVMRGPVNPTTGVVISNHTLDGYLDMVRDVLDHKCLDRDVDHFKLVVPTNENIAVFIWEFLASNMSSKYKPLLHEVRLWSGGSQSNSVVFRGTYRK